jgi:predicted dehydrogenase
MDRRTFMVQVMAGSAALGTAGRIRIAFLGGSHSHGLDKAKVVKASPLYELAGIWEPDPAVLAQYAALGIPRLEREDILSDTSIGAVAVESDVKDHARHGLMVLEAGKHVHLEKPPADNLDEVRRMVDLARSKGLVFQTGYMWRYNPAITAALEAAWRGWLGDVYLVRGMMNTLIPPERRPEWAAFQGGQMFEQGPHMIDPIVRLLGRPQRVTPFLHRHGKYNDRLMDNTVAVLEYPQALGIVQSSTLQPNASLYRTLEIQGTNGTATVRPIEPPVLQIDLASAAGPYKTGKQMVAVPPYKRYEGDFEELAAAVRGERPLRVSLDEELLLQETLTRACGM